MQVSNTQDNVLIVGHPYVDIWQAVKPEVIGIQAWPKIPRSEDWKTGMLARLGLPHTTPADIGLGWKKILAQVNSFTDLEAALLGRVEHRSEERRVGKECRGGRATDEQKKKKEQ